MCACNWNVVSITLVMCLEVMMTPFLFQERMTLKHSSATKWARQQLTRGHKDPAVSVGVGEEGMVEREGGVRGERGWE